LTLPIADAAARPASLAHRTDKAADGVVLDILVAEDEMINQMVIRGLLPGHRVTVTGNGREAVSAVQAGSFDVILMDVMMPDMDGLQATAAIRALSSPAASLPIIALTANSMSGDRQRYLAAGMNGYVSKPVDRKRLFEVIEEVTGMAIWHPPAAGVPLVPAPEASPLAALEVDNFLASLDARVN
jgi:CheY-like chemotaxis protein